MSAIFRCPGSGTLLGSIVLSDVELLFKQALREIFSDIFRHLQFRQFLASKMGCVCCLPQIHWSSSYFASRLQILDVRQFIQMDVPAMRSQTKNNVSNMSDLQHFALSFITHPWLWWPVSCPHAKDITLSDVGGIILSSTRTTPQRWCLRFPMGSKNIPSIPIQLANSRCDPPHVGTTEQENIVHDAIWAFDGKHHAKC